MTAILASPVRALLLGLAASALIMIAWLIGEGADWIGFVSFLLRWVHVVAAMIWIGMIWFVNFIQLTVVSQLDESGRATILRSIVPRVATTFRHFSHATVLSGVLLLITTGYMLDRLVFSAPAYIPPLRNILLWASALGGIAMWVLVHALIWPALRIVLGECAASDVEKAAARARVLICARWNLVLMLPVTLGMVAAAHLY